MVEGMSLVMGEGSEVEVEMEVMVMVMPGEGLVIGVKKSGLAC